jgi:hypothetical protein
MDKQEMIAKLQAFKKAARELTEAWEVCQDDKELLRIDDILTHLYPFSYCFREMAGDISTWCGEAIERLEA